MNNGHRHKSQLQQRCNLLLSFQEGTREALPNPPHSNLRQATSLAHFCPNHLNQAQKVWQEGPPCTSGVCGYSSVPRHAGERAEVADVTPTSWSLHRWQQVHTEHMWQTWEGLETLEERICCLLHLLVWQVCWRVVLGKNILGGLERPLSPSLGWERQTQCWCSGFSIPDVAGVH